MIEAMTEPKYPMRKLLLPLVLVLALMTTGCLKQHLQSGLTETEAQEIVVLLKEHGIDAATEREAGDEKEGSKWTVNVLGGDQNLVVAWRVLRENGLPREKEKGLSDVFAGGGMIPTAAEEKARLLVGLSGEIGRTLKSVKGVVDARVHVVLPDNSPLLDKSQWSPTTASVLIKFQGSQPPLKEAEVKELVSKGVEGLQPDNVGVVFNRVIARGVPPQDWWFYFGNQQILVVTLGLLALVSVGTLGLVVKGRHQRLRIQQLEKALEHSSRSQIAG